MGPPVFCKLVLSGVRCAAASMLVELELVSMTVGLQQHANLFAVCGCAAGSLQHGGMSGVVGLVSNWLHSHRLHLVG
jgi:hypothetical protein